MNLTRISKFISLVLRHKPEEAEISLNRGGWANVEELIKGVNTKMDASFGIKELEKIVETDDKNRYSFNDDKTLIRANQGHSINVDLGLKPLVPPIYLYHGTASKYFESIYDKGILPKSRMYVHLSGDIDTAEKVGKRHGTPVIFRVSAREMYEDGYSLYLSENGVWLTDSVPPKYLQAIRR